MENAPQLVLQGDALHHAWASISTQSPAWLLHTVPVWVYVAFVALFGWWMTARVRAAKAMKNWRFDCPEVERDGPNLGTTLRKGLVQVRTYMSQYLGSSSINTRKSTPTSRSRS